MRLPWINKNYLAGLTIHWLYRPSVLKVGNCEPFGAGQARNVDRSTSGSPETIVGLIDGPVVINHPDLADVDIHQIPSIPGTCAQAGRAACLHGTFVAGILCAKRGSIAPAICPSCTLLVRPIFAETSSADGQLPNASPEELADAVADCIEAGVHEAIPKFVI
jgi:hypothetical protein